MMHLFQEGYFHFGIYLVGGTTFVMIARAILGAISPGIVTGGFGILLSYVCISLGAAGLFLGIIGALGLLHRRLNHPDLKDYTAPADIFNLIFFVVAFSVTLGHFLVVDRDLSRSMFFVDNFTLLTPCF